jgi:hypothetical protein
MLMLQSIKQEYKATDTENSNQRTGVQMKDFYFDTTKEDGFILSS